MNETVVCIFCTKLTIFAYIKYHKMRFITVDDVIHTWGQTQITPDVQTHCLLVALINVVFFIEYCII